MNGTTLELIISLLPTILGVGGVISAFTFVMAYVANSKRQGMIQSDTEKWKQMIDENRYLTNKNNYLEMKFRKVEEVVDDLQRQINSLSAHVCEIPSHQVSRNILVTSEPVMLTESKNLPAFEKVVHKPQKNNYNEFDHPKRQRKGTTIGLSVGNEYL